MVTDIVEIGGYTLRNLNKINIVLGKNGCGKSTLLRLVEKNLVSKDPSFGITKYITPERGGALIYDAGTEQNLISNTSWLANDRRRNQSAQFKQQSVAQYRKLETLVLREIEKDKRKESKYTFDIYVKELNLLLDNIEIKRHDAAFRIYKRGLQASWEQTQLAVVRAS